VILASTPITEVLPRILSVLQAQTRLVLEAPPGAGKTTQVPIALLQAPWRGDRKILLLEPRRVAARAAANFMAKQLGESVGETVGYRIRFENKISAKTKIEVVTEGILTRMIQDDPSLENIAAILFDEFHERHLSGDLGLALALDIQQSLREDLRIVLMSATLDGEKLAQFLQAERITSVGRSYPVTTSYFPARRDEALVFQIKRCIEETLQKHQGDLLVFLPGQREINQLEKALVSISEVDAISIITLYGEMPIEKQSEALAPDKNGKRRIVLATNIAESSVTLPGVRVVIDSGLSREPRFDPNSGFSRLETVSISQASADQRAGRAGRVAEGWCYRMWPASQRLETMRSAEISQTELSSLALELAAWGSSDLRFVEAPPAGALAAAVELLQRLNALDSNKRITALGKKILALGTHPRIAAMLLAAQNDQEKVIACDLAALIEARDPLIGERRDDWASRWQALQAYRSGRLPANVNRSAIAAIDQASVQWRRRLRCDEKMSFKTAPTHALGDLLLHAFPERIAKQHPNDPRRYQMANGRMAKIFDDSLLFGEPWLAISECRFDNKDSMILRAAPLDEIRLQQDFPARFSEQDSVRWDVDVRGLIARREKRFDQIILESKPAGRPDPVKAAQALCDAVAELGTEALPWTENLKQWRERVRCLSIWMPDLALPDFSNEALLAKREFWLKPALQGKTRLDGLSEQELSEALKSELDWSTRQKIDQLAPTKILVPSGMERGIEYHHEASPVLAVKLQELFGLADTPRICEGRVILTLHLLSPGGKPLQITQDLKGFWERTYPEVKKEMKGRYPRHPWPDDPWSATATHRAKPRGT